MQLDLEAGVALGELADGRRQQLAGDGGHGAQGQPPAGGGGRAADVLRRRLQLDQAGNPDRQEAVAELGQGDAAGGAVEQAEAELLLQLPDQHAHPRLGDVELFRGAREALVARRQQESFQLSRGDIHALF